MRLERRDLRRWDGARYRPVLFARPGCARSAALREHLAARGLTAIEFDIEADNRALRLLLTMAGRAWVPTVIFRHEIAVGCDVSRLEELLNTPYAPLEDFCQDDEPETAGSDEEAVVEPEAVLSLVEAELELR
ncbi:MAG: hypothetical protein HYS05_16435 [Acidobacteria bacterium]|nr:hypothetical protein [Acidobacteriota bacterium]